MPKLPKALEPIAANEELWLPVAAAWLVGGPLFTIWGFYVGMVVGPNHAIDLQWQDFRSGAWGALFGAVVGLAVALYATFVFPKVRARPSAEH